MSRCSEGFGVFYQFAHIELIDVYGGILSSCLISQVRVLDISNGWCVFCTLQPFDFGFLRIKGQLQ
tara:strand:+ start:332 stop:529 length:198 start_codon:yes stop_codon:yes gene_type:complete